MADWVTISSLATAGGTLVLAVATFSSVRSANRSARVAERSFMIGMRPVLIPSREDDLLERIRFGDGQIVQVPGHGGAAEVHSDNIFMAVGLRNGGNGLAVIHGWRARVRHDPSNPGAGRPNEAPDLDEFRAQQLDIYIPAGDSGYWQGALRDPADAGLRRGPRVTGRRRRDPGRSALRRPRGRPAHHRALRHRPVAHR